MRWTGAITPPNPSKCTKLTGTMNSSWPSRTRDLWPKISKPVLTRPWRAATRKGQITNYETPFLSDALFARTSHYCNCRRHHQRSIERCADCIDSPRHQSRSVTGSGPGMGLRRIVHPAAHLTFRGTGTPDLSVAEGHFRSAHAHESEDSGCSAASPRRDRRAAFARHAD